MVLCHVCGMAETGGMIVAWNLIDWNLNDEYPDLQPCSVFDVSEMYSSKKVMSLLQSSLE